MGRILSKKATSENFINPPVQETVQDTVQEKPKAELHNKKTHPLEI